MRTDPLEIQVYRSDALADAALFFTSIGWIALVSVVLFLWVQIWRNRGQF
jgi:hypothetical protein